MSTNSDTAKDDIEILKKLRAEIDGVDEATTVNEQDKKVSLMNILKGFWYKMLIRDFCVNLGFGIENTQCSTEHDGVSYTDE